MTHSPVPDRSIILIEVRAGDSDILQLLWLQNSDAPALKPDPSVLLPGAQPLVCAFPRSAHDLADLALRNRHLSTAIRVLSLRGESNQSLGQPCGQIEKRHFVGLLARIAQSRTEDFHQFERNIGLALQEWNELPSLNRHELAIAHRGGVGRARAAVEQRDFAKDFAFANDVERNDPAIGGGDADLDRARQDSHQPEAGIALSENNGAFGDGAFPEVGTDTIEGDGRELAK